MFICLELLCVAKSCNEAEILSLIFRFQLVPNEKKEAFDFFILISYHFTMTTTSHNFRSNIKFSNHSCTFSLKLQ